MNLLGNRILAFGFKVQGLGVRFLASVSNMVLLQALIAPCEVYLAVILECSEALNMHCQ